MQCSAAGIAIAATSGKLFGASSSVVRSTGAAVTTEADVLVVGGGAAGTIAAIAAGRPLVHGTLVVR